MSACGRPQSRHRVVSATARDTANSLEELPWPAPSPPWRAQPARGRWPASRADRSRLPASPKPVILASTAGHFRLVGAGKSHGVDRGEDDVGMRILQAPVIRGAQSGGLAPARAAADRGDPHDHARVREGPPHQLGPVAGDRSPPAPASASRRTWCIPVPAGGQGRWRCPAPPARPNVSTAIRRRLVSGADERGLAEQCERRGGQSAAESSAPAPARTVRAPSRSSGAIPARPRIACLGGAALHAVTSSNRPIASAITPATLSFRSPAGWPR